MHSHAERGERSESQQRVRGHLQDAGRLDEAALKASGVQGVMVLAGGVVNLLTGL